VLNTETYQRTVRPGESLDRHLRFASTYPTKLRADALWESLVGVLGNLSGPQGFMPPRPMGGPPGLQRPGLEGMVNQECDFDPSLKSSDVEGSVPQALLLMNNPQIQQKIRATGTNLLGRVLSAYPKDEDALGIVYLRAWAVRRRSANATSV
jgi:hypothetical protein